MDPPRSGRHETQAGHIRFAVLITIPIGAVTLAEAERMVIEATLEDAGSITQAALVLEVQRGTLAA